MVNMSFKASEVALLALSVATFALGANAEAVAVTVSLARRLVKLDSVNDVAIQSMYMLLSYVLQYAVLGGLFEGTHPNGVLSTKLAPAAVAQRRSQVKFEIITGVVSLTITVVLAVSWMYWVEPTLWTYGYFETHAWSWAWATAAVVAYIGAFDTWFFFTHLILHESDTLWHSIHYFHHQYKEPSAFAQFAVHPVEALIQGPLGHFAVQLLCPVHPIQLAIMGFLSSAWAFAAHDGRGGDFNSHYFHHSKGRGRKHYFNLGFITPFWDVVWGTRWAPDHPLWVSWQKRSSGEADTRDGTAEGISNDAFSAYKQTHKAKEL